LNNFTNISSEFTPQAGLVPFHPDAKGLTINDVGMFKVINSRQYCYSLFICLATPNGILAVNYLDANHDDFGISYQILNTDGGTFQNTITYRTIAGNINWLRSK